MIFNSNREKLIFYSFPVLLFSLLPFFLITGPFLSDLSISLISIIFLVYCFKEKNFFYFKNKYFYFFLIFWIYLVLNILLNNFNFDSFGTAIVYFRYGVFVIAVVALLDTDHKFIKYFFYCALICFLALIFDGYYQYFVGENILGYKTPNSYRVSSFFGEEQILGHYLSRLWPLFFGLSIYIFQQKNKLFYLLVAIFILSETLIFLSGDRTAFFYINLSAIFVILFSRNLLKLRLFTLISSILLIVAISYFNPIATERVIDKTLSQMNLVDQENEMNDEVYIFSKQHTHHYITAYRMFLDNKILGVGIKNFRDFCGDERYNVSELSCSTHPHNAYMQILSETGIIGFLFLFTTLFYFCKNLIKHIILKFQDRQYFSDFDVCILSGIVIYLWPFAPTLNVFNNWINIAMIINLPFLFWSLKKENIKN